MVIQPKKPPTFYNVGRLLLIWGKKHIFPLNIFMLFHVEFHVGFLSVDIRHLHHIILISFHDQPAGKATMFLDFNPIFVETAQFLSAKRKIVWLRTILRYAANELRTYRTPPKRHSDVIICPKKDPSPLLYHSSKKAFTRSYFLYTNALK